MCLDRLGHTGEFEIVIDGIDKPDGSIDGLSLIDNSFLRGVQEVHEVGINFEAELNPLLFSQKLIYIPVAHIIYKNMKTLEMKQLACCPFDRSHLIEPSKLLKHIDKCKASTKHDYSKCPYNPYHWVNFQHIE